MKISVIYSYIIFDPSKLSLVFHTEIAIIGISIGRYIIYILYNIKVLYTLIRIRIHWLLVTQFYNAYLYFTIVYNNTF